MANKVAKKVTSKVTSKVTKKVTSKVTRKVTRKVAKRDHSSSRSSNSRTNSSSRGRSLLHHSPFHLNELPNEILEIVFQFLTIHERVRMRCVCRRWKALALARLPQLTTRFWTSTGFALSTVDLLYFKRPQSCLKVVPFLLKEVGFSLQRLKIKLPHCITSEPIQIAQDIATLWFENIAQHCPNIKFLQLSRLNRVMIPSLVVLLNQIGPQLAGFQMKMKNHIENYFVNVNEIVNRLNPQRIRSLKLTAICEQVHLILKRFASVSELNILFLSIPKPTNPIQLQFLNQLRSLRYGLWQDHSDLDFKHSFSDFPASFDCPSIADQLTELKMTGITVQGNYAFLKQFHNLRTLKMSIFNRIDLSNVTSLNKLRKLSLQFVRPISTKFDELLKIPNLSVLTSLALYSSTIRINLHLPFELLEPMPMIAHFRLTNINNTCNEDNAILPNVVRLFPSVQMLDLDDENLTPQLAGQQFARLSKLKLLNLFCQDTLKQLVLKSVDVATRSYALNRKFRRAQCFHLNGKPDRWSREKVRCMINNQLNRDYKL